MNKLKNAVNKKTQEIKKCINLKKNVEKNYSVCGITNLTLSIETFRLMIETALLN